jgi:hypothetical protein
MIRSNVFRLPHSDLNEFLLADVGVQLNGLSVTVLSLLARSGVDPWSEAERLAALPPAAAITVMTSSIDSSPTCVLTGGDPASTASRLVALLPHQATETRLGGSSYDAFEVMHARLAILFFCGLAGALLFSALLSV